MRKIISGLEIIFGLSFILALAGAFLSANLALAGDLPWPMSGANSFKNRRAAGSGPAVAPCTLWQFKAPAGAFSGDPVVGPDGTIYIGTTAGAVYALDRESGSVKWSVSLGYPVIGSPAVDSGAVDSTVVYVVYGRTDDSGDVFALCSLSAREGTLRWSLRGPPLYGGDDTPITASPTVMSDGIYVPLMNGLWKIKPSAETDWLYTGLTYGNKNHCSPAVAEGKVMFVTSGGRVYVLSDSDGQLMWLTTLAGSFEPLNADEITSAVSPDGRVMYCCFKNVAKVYAVYTVWSGLKWSWSLPGAGPFRPAAVGADGTVYVSDAGGGLYALNPENGSLIWSSPPTGKSTDGSPAIGGDGTVYLLRGLTLCAFDPDGSLKWEHALDAGINGAGSPVIAGNGIVLARTGSDAGEAFLFAVGPDTVPPEAIAYDPPAGAEDVPVGTNLALTFTESVVAQEGKLITIKNWENDAVAEEIPASGDRVAVNGQVVTVNPAGDLHCGTRYYVLIDPAAFRDLAGNDFAGIGDKGVWSFTTVLPPEVLSTDPADGASGVPLDKTIMITFSKDVQSGDAASGIKIYKTNEPASVVAFTYSFEGNVLTLDPQSALGPGVAYTVYLPEGAVQNLAGYPMVADYVCGFTTVPGAPGNLTAEAVSPTAVELNWEASEGDADVLEGYSVEMRQGEEGNYAVLGTTAETAYQAAGLRPGTAYAFRVRAFDAAGNYSGYSNEAAAVTAEEEPEENTTAPDVIPPEVVSTSPVDGEMNVPINLVIAVTFSEAVEPGESCEQIVLRLGDKGTSISKSTSGSTLTIIPRGTLAYGTSYTVSIPAGAVRDLAGNPLAADYAFCFTTCSISSANVDGEAFRTPADKNKVEKLVQPGLVTIVELPGIVRVEAPAGVISGSHAVLGVGVVDGGGFKGAGMPLLGPGVEITVKNGRLTGELIVTLYYDQGQPGGDKEPVAFTYDEKAGRWVKMGGRAGTARGEVTFTTDRPALFALFAVAEENLESRVAFPDLGGHWAEKTVLRLAAMGIVAGYLDGTFRPDRAVTRLEGSAILARALKSVPAFRRDPLLPGWKFAGADDIPAWARNLPSAAVWVAWDELLKSYPEKEGTPAFDPDGPITRTELAALVARLAERGLGPAAPVEPGFVDAAVIPAWAKRDVGAAAAMGLVGGYPDRTFRAEKPATRAEAASMILRLLNLLQP